MDKKKANTNIKTTMDFFKQKRLKTNNKKLFSHIAINSNNDKTNSTTSTQFNSTMQGVYKSDIFQIDSYLLKMKQILMYFSEERENLLLYNKDFNKKINTIKENMAKDTKDCMATHRINSLNLNYLLREYKCNDKETLISDIAFENLTLKLLLEKLDDLFFLINLKVLDSQNKFSKGYKNNLSPIVNVKYLCETISNTDNLNLDFSKNKFKQSFNLSELEGLDKTGLLPLSHMNTKNLENVIKEVEEPREKEKGEEKTIKESKNEDGTTKKTSDKPKINQELHEIPLDIVTDINDKIKIFDKIRELFYIYNKSMFDPIVDLINTKFQVKSALSNKVQIVLKNEVNECYENVVLIRKILEDNFKENENKIKELNNDKRIMENRYKEIEVKFNKQKKTLDEYHNRDYKEYYKQMKESNDLFLKEFEAIEKQRNEKLYEQYENQLEKNRALKKELKDCKAEVFALKMKIDNMNVLKEKSDDDYVSALQEQFEDAKQSFQEQISDLAEEYNKKRKDVQQKYKALENENKHLKGIQAAILKKFDAMERLFSK